MQRLIALRSAAALIAACAWIAELLFLVVNVRSMGFLIALWNLTRFLTDWATTTVAIVCTLIALGGESSVSRFWRALATLMTTLVGVMFAGIGGLDVVVAQGWSSILAHVVVPILMLAFWTIILPHRGMSWIYVPWMMSYPAGYMAVMFARGAAGDGYPYRFVNVPRVGWSNALVFAGATVAIALLLATLLVGVDRLLARRRRSLA